MYLFCSPTIEMLWVSMVLNESDEGIVCPKANFEINMLRKKKRLILFRLNINNEAKIWVLKAFGNTYNVVF
jgi:hypothetical protein